MWVGWVEGSRQIAFHGYPGDGTASLGDFSLYGFLDRATLKPSGSYDVSIDATAFLQDLITGGKWFAGFNVREDPPNRSNYTVLFFSTKWPTAPRLSVDYVTQEVPEPSVFLLFGAGALALLCAGKLSRQRSATCAGTAAPVFDRPSEGHCLPIRRGP
jgi:hypothetical protein